MKKEVSENKQSDGGQLVIKDEESSGKIETPNVMLSNDSQDKNKSEDTSVQVTKVQEISIEPPIVDDEYVTIAKEPTSPQNVVNINLQIPKVSVPEAEGTEEAESVNSFVNGVTSQTQNSEAELVKQEQTFVVHSEVGSVSGDDKQEVIIAPPSAFVDETEAKEVEDTIVKETSKPREMAFSNLIYSDHEFKQEFNDKAEVMKMDLSSKQDDMRLDSNETDAYVQLQNIVEEHAQTVEPEIKEPELRKQETTKRSSPIRESFVNCMAKTFEATVTPKSQASRSVMPVMQANKVVLMKDVGVQAPDIHMPLDKTDFGVSDTQGATVSVGVQVNTMGTVTDHEGDTITEPETNGVKENDAAFF